MKFLFIFLGFSQGAFGLCAPIDSYPHCASLKKARLLFARVHEKEFDPDTKDECGWTALHYAVRYREDKTAALLLEKGADPNIKTDSGQETALEILLWRNNDDFCLEYIAGQPYIGYIGPEWHNFNLRNYSILIPLLENGADPDTKDETGRALLHIAADDRDNALLAFLLESGADPNIQDRSAWTALQYAALQKKAVETMIDSYPELDFFFELEEVEERIALLLESGADPIYGD